MLGFTATILAAVIGAYFTWSQDQHQRLTTDLELVQKLQLSQSLGVEEHEYMLGVLSSLPEEEIFVRISSMLPQDKQISLLSRMLYRAIHTGDYALVAKVRKILKPFQFASNEFQLFPLAAAVSERDLPMLKYLVSLGFDPAKEPMMASDGLSALMVAARDDNADAIDYLVRHGARLDDQGNDGTPLHYAVKNGNVSAVRMLLEFHADPNAKNAKGLTPLVAALDWETVGVLAQFTQAKTTAQIVHLLIQHGADVNAYKPFAGGARNGRSALALAVDSNNDESFGLLMAAGANTATNTPGADSVALDVAGRSNTAMLKVLLAHGFDPNFSDRTFGFTMLENQTFASKDFTEALLAAGARPNTRDKNGDTPIIQWFSYKVMQATTPAEHWKVVLDSENELLAATAAMLRHGANVNLAGQYQITALCNAARYFSGRSVAFLIKAGARMDLRCGEEHQTAIDMAARSCNATTLAALLVSDPGAKFASGGRASLLKSITDNIDLQKRYQADHPDSSAPDDPSYNCDDSASLARGDEKPSAYLGTRGI